MLKIERSLNGPKVVLRLSGRLTLEHIEELRSEIGKEVETVALDLQEIIAVDFEVVHFFGTCEEGGIELQYCPRYLRQWINQERTKEHQARLGLQ